MHLMKTGNAERTLGILRVLLALALCVVLVPLLVACVYNRPLADDFAQPYPVYQTYQQTGSVWAMIVAAARTAADIWVQRSGIFFSMFLSALAPTVFDYRFCWLHPIAGMLFLLFSVLYACRSLKVLGEDISNSLTDCIGLMICFFLFFFIPSSREAFFWYSGMINYTFMTAWEICFFASLFTACHRPASVGWGKVFLWCVGFFLLGGSNHLTAASSVVIFGFFCLYFFTAKKPLRYYLPFLFLLAGFLLASLAPGHSWRQAAGAGEPRSMPVAFVEAFRQAFLFAFQDARYWLALVPFVPLLVLFISKMNGSFRRAYLVPIGSLIILAANFFPLMLTNYTIFDRHLNTFFITLFVLLVINLGVLVGYLYHRLQVQVQVPMKRYLLTWGLAALIVIGVLSLPEFSLQPFQFGTNLEPVKALSHWMDGSMKTYTEKYDAIVEEVRNHPGERIVVRELPYDEVLGCLFFLEDPSDWQNDYFARTFGGEGTSIVYEKTTE